MRKYLGLIYGMLAFCLAGGAYSTFQTGVPLSVTLFSGFEAALTTAGTAIYIWALFYVPFKYIRHFLACRRAKEADQKFVQEHGADSAVNRVRSVIAHRDPRVIHFLDW